MRTLAALGFVLALTATAAAQTQTRADTLTLGPLGPATAGPQRGITMTEVEQRLGPPQSKSGPVGEPPISVWHYPGFNVYFEYDKVLHSTERR